MTSSALRALQNNTFLGSAPITSAKATKGGGMQARWQFVWQLVNHRESPEARELATAFVARLPRAFCSHGGDVIYRRCYFQMRILKAVASGEKLKTAHLKSYKEAPQHTHTPHTYTNILIFLLRTFC